MLRVSLGLLPVAVLVLSGCAPVVALEPAKYAASPDCAAVSVRLPQSIDDLAKRETNAQATAAWGQPSAVLLRCGLEPAVLSNDVCLETEDLDVSWLVDDSQAPTYRFTSYGRTPAVEVIIDNTVVSGSTALGAVDRAVAQLPLDGHRCVDLGDAVIVPEQ